MTQNSVHPVEAMMSFWKDAWARSAAAGTPPAAGPGGAAPGSDPLGWMPTPEQVRRMQASFLDALSQASDQYMRSPQFLESMKASLDSGLQMRRQMEELLRRQMAEAMGPSGVAAPGHSNADVIGALHELESRLMSRIAELSARLDAMTSAITAAMTSAATSETTSDAPTPGQLDGGSRPRRSTRG
jgi:hypothetical protein